MSEATSAVTMAIQQMLRLFNETPVQGNALAEAGMRHLDLLLQVDVVPGPLLTLCHDISVGPQTLLIPTCSWVVRSWLA